MVLGRKTLEVMKFPVMPHGKRCMAEEMVALCALGGRNAFSGGYRMAGEFTLPCTLDLFCVGARVKLAHEAAFNC